MSKIKQQIVNIDFLEVWKTMKTTISRQNYPLKDNYKAYPVVLVFIELVVEN